MTAGILELAIVVLIAAFLGVAMKLLKQPIILAYLATGVLIGIGARLGFLSSFALGDGNTFQIFADLGIMFLLFLVGLEVNYKSIRLVGRASLILGVLQILFTFTIGYFIALGLGFATLASAYISIALTFSSTIIIVTLLSEKKQMGSLYGRISIGLLLVQDFVAVLLLVALSGIESGGSYTATNITETVVTGIALFAVIIWVGRRFFPYLFSKVARSQELLFLLSLAWVFLVVAVASKLGFSIEVGGFLAGLALANASEHYEIASRVRPLRDFFILIFFAILGSSLVFVNLIGLVVPIILFSLFVLIGNPLIMLIVMGFMGYRKRTSFLTGITIAQISEFSLVLAALGLKLGHIGYEVVSLITTVGVITITLSTYMVMRSDDLYRFLGKYLSHFERRVTVAEGHFYEAVSKPVVLVGFRRTGQSIAMHLKKEDLLVIDFDPEIIQALHKHGYASIFGDIADAGIFDQISFVKTRLIISTSPTLEDNLTLLEMVKRRNMERGRNAQSRLKLILRAEGDVDAEILYRQGADYVLLPHFTSGHYLGCIIAGDFELSALKNAKRREMMMLRKEDEESAALVCEGPLMTEGEARNLQKHV